MNPILCTSYVEGESSSLSQNGSTALKLSGKSRSSSGPATDPQSLYAR
ncbi:transcription factor bHLH84-like, partial [Trifolium medium]|nr:transcription factor bHLH84-like [Trifolium medium]